MLLEWGIPGPRAFGELPARDRYFIESGWPEYVDRTNKSINQ